MKIEPVINPKLKKIVCYNIQFPNLSDLPDISLTVKELDKIERIGKRLKDLEADQSGVI